MDVVADDPSLCQSLVDAINSASGPKAYRPKTGLLLNSPVPPLLYFMF
jgi:hypothetical protein